MPPPDAASADLTATEARAWRRRVGWIIAALLLAGVVFALVRERGTVAAAFDHLADLPTSQLLGGIGILVASVLANLVLTGFLFSLLMSRYGRVGLLEMQAVMAASSLINYVPLRPGLVGRAAYHKTRNDIPVINTVKTVFQAAALSVGVSAVIAILIVLANLLARPLWPFVLLPLPPLVLAGWLWPTSRIFTLAALLRYIEVLVVALRYWAVFDLIGSPIGLDTALALACVNVVSTMVPLVSNGLGLREWAIGLTGHWLADREIALGLTADLVNRGAEIIVICTVGGLAIWWLWRHGKARFAAKTAFPP